MEIGKTYVQTFANGDKVFFRPLEERKNGAFKGMKSDFFVGMRKPSKEKTYFAHPATWTGLWKEIN